MGVGFSHGGAHWSYSGFNSFRSRLAKSIGINLYDYEGFYTEKEWQEYFETQELPPKKKWDIDDPIVELLNHSDCEGHLTPEQCKKIAPRLRELVEDWEKTTTIKTEEVHQMLGYPPIMDFDSYDRTNAIMLAEGMEKAISLNENFEFH